MAALNLRNRSPTRLSGIPASAFRIERPPPRLVFSADGSPKIRKYRSRGAYLNGQNNNNDQGASNKLRDSVTTTSDRRGVIED